MDRITILDKSFKVSIPAKTIQETVKNLAGKINADFAGNEIVFIAVLNGAFVFASDLFKQIQHPARISFLKLASYQGLQSSGEVKQLIGLNEEIKSKNVMILEDIVDTGNTLETTIKQLEIYSPASIHVASLLYKPEADRYKRHLDYVGFEIPNDFVVGYGLDYEGLGRNLPSIYTLTQ